MAFCLRLLLVALCSAKICNIVSYGAKGDNKTDNTAFIAKAISDCANNGEIVIPSPGMYQTYPLIVRGTNLTITVEPGATLRAGARENWPVSNNAYVNFLVFTSCVRCTLRSSSMPQEDFVVSDEQSAWPHSGLSNGLIDGGGTPWYIAFDNNQLKYQRPFLIEIYGGSAFAMLHIWLLNSPMFNIALENVLGAEFGFLNITAQWYEKDGKLMEPHNTDGIDPGGGSSSVHIHDCYINNGDDSVAVKPGNLGACTRDILVENMHVANGHGLSIGSVGQGCVENVMFRNVVVESQLAGCRVKTYSQGPGFVTNITWNNITLSNTDNCVVVQTNYIVTNITQYINVTNLVFQEIHGTGCQHTAQFTCQAARPCRDISLDHVSLTADARYPNMVCANAYGVAVDVDPHSCLMSQ